MPKKTSSRTTRGHKESFQDRIPHIEFGLKEETKRGVRAIGCFVIALIFFLAAFGSAGPAGSMLYIFFTKLFGLGYVLVPLTLLLLGVSYLRPTTQELATRHTVGSVFFLLASLGILDRVSDTHSGGAIGKLVHAPFLSLFGPIVSAVILTSIICISLLVLFDTLPTWQTFLSLFKRHQETEDDEYEEDDPEEEPIKDTKKKQKAVVAEEEEEEVVVPKPPKEKPLIKEPVEEFVPKPVLEEKDSNYVFPPLSLLEKDRGKPNVGDVKANANIIKRTLQNFGIEVEMDEITIGPTVTRYALKPAEGVKLSRIVALQNDLALALAAHPLRIEAPIPGKSLVGIEIPNRAKAIIGFASLLDDQQFTHSPKPLMVALGKNISGKAIFANLAKMPHVLVAGATGSGKSVTAHAIITSLLYRNAPEDLRFIMVDPKRVELTLYNKIPHLLTPVITDPKKAILALKWAAKEMDRRYNLLEEHSVRDIDSYHTNVYKKWLDKNKKTKKLANEEEVEHGPERMPYIVIIIDELADIMQAYPRELEAGIVRLAQMSRAVGIHLILSTQRPSVNVITGLIKANVPARIALQVASQIDSRTILDATGAEKLLGAGDMLYASGEMSSPERVQCAYVSEEEVKRVVKFLAENAGETTLGNELSLSEGNIGADSSIFNANLDESGGDDDLYEEARETVIAAGKASTSFLQRKLGVGYARAAKLIDMLEERGVVGAGNGAKPREVLEKSVESERAGFE